MSRVHSKQKRAQKHRDRHTRRPAVTTAWEPRIQNKLEHWNHQSTNQPVENDVHNVESDGMEAISKPIVPPEYDKGRITLILASYPVLWCKPTNNMECIAWKCTNFSKMWEGEWTGVGNLQGESKFFFSQGNSCWICKSILFVTDEATIKAKRFICILKEPRVTLSFVVKSKLVTVLSLFQKLTEILCSLSLWDGIGFYEIAHKKVQI